MTRERDFDTTKIPAAFAERKKRLHENVFGPMYGNPVSRVKLPDDLWDNLSSVPDPRNKDDGQMRRLAEILGSKASRK